MPIYEYQCAACGYHFEAFQKISEAPLSACPECEQPTLSKLVSATSFRLKGTGWYATDFRNPSSPKAAAASEANPPQAETASAKPAEAPAESSSSSSSSTT